MKWAFNNMAIKTKAALYLTTSAIVSTFWMSYSSLYIYANQSSKLSKSRFPVINDTNRQ